MLSAWRPPSFNSRKRAPGPMLTLDTIGGDRGAPGPTTVRALAHQRKNRPQCRKRLTVTHAMPAVSSTVGRRVSAGGNYRIKSQRCGRHTCYNSTVSAISNVGGDFGSGRRRGQSDVLLTAWRGSRSFEERQLRSYQGRGHGANRRPPSVKCPFRALGEQQVANGQPRDRK